MFFIKVYFCQKPPESHPANNRRNAAPKLINKTHQGISNEIAITKNRWAAAQEFARIQKKPADIQL